jgi:putative ABC transport system permease protein
LRRSLLAESLVLCGSGVLAALILAWPMVALLGRYAARFLQTAIKEWAYARRY